MCGITGFFGEGNAAILKTMSSSLTHRGPDEEGMFVRGELHLAHRRLSIIDLSPTGAQPMHSQDGAVTIVFNGEIYNYQELKQTLLASSTFRGGSDTEVILHLYERYGMDFLSKLDGMFALALFDSRTGVLTLARDAYGEKPLYYAHVGRTLIFGSELKALRAHPLCPHTVSVDAVAAYLVHEYIPGEATIYEGVHTVSPGTFMTFDGSACHREYYFDIRTPHEPTIPPDSEHGRTLSTLLENAVQSRMVADVPVGVFLSGGLDSSTIAYYAQKHMGGGLKTFSICFDDPSFDESAYARIVAKHLGTEHYERVVSENDLEQVLRSLPDILDEPMADSSILPTVLLSQFARKEVKVALGGDGADELFCGYGTFLASDIAQKISIFPQPVTRALKTLSTRLPVTHAYMSLDFKIKKFFEGYDAPMPLRNTYWLSAFTPEQLDPVLAAPYQKALLCAHTSELYQNAQEQHDALFLEYATGYLPHEILVKTDRASMRHGLEVRAPFLSKPLVSFARSLPHHEKLRGTTGKYLLKKVMEPYLPYDIIYRKKHGFGVPIGSWIRGKHRELFSETLLHGSLVSSGLFKQKGIAILLDEHREGKADHRKKIWSLFVLALWMNTWQ